MEGLYYPYSENKGADQLRGYGEADLRLCFRICKKPVFSRRGSLRLVRVIAGHTVLFICFDRQSSIYVIYILLFQHVQSKLAGRPQLMEVNKSGNSSPVSKVW